MSKKPTSIRKAKKEAKKLLQTATVQKRPENAVHHSNKAKMSLHEAYEILGGYTSTVSRNKYDQAFKMVMAVDPDFAKVLYELNKTGISFASASRENIASAEQIVQNAKQLDTEYSNDASLRKEVMESKDIAEILENTPAVDLSGNEYSELTFRTAQIDVIPELAENEAFANADTKEKHTMLVDRLKNSIKRTIFRARLASLGHDAKSFRNAFNFKKKITVSAVSVAGAFENAQKKTSAFISKLYKKGHTKAAALLNKAKTKASSAMVKIAAVSVVLSSVLPSCNPNSNRNVDRMPMDAKIFAIQDTTKTSQSILSGSKDTDTVRPFDDAQQTSVSVPTEWNENMGITESQWDRLQLYWGSRDNFEIFYQKIDSQMLRDGGIFAGKTREQVLFQYERMSSWNLPQHREAIVELDAFFGDCNGKVSKEMAEKLDDVLEDGSIRDVLGTLNVRVTGRDVDCSEGSVLYTETSEEMSETIEEPVAVDAVEVEATAEQSSTTTYNFETTGETTIVDNTQVSTVSPDISVHKSNEKFSDSKKIDSMSAAEIAQTEVKAKKNILVEQNDGNASQKVTYSFDSENSLNVEEGKNSGQSQRYSFEEKSDIETNISASSRTFSFDEQETVQSSDKSVANTRSMNFVFDDNGSSVVRNSSQEEAQVVTDSDDLPKGTPAAGNVAERGGFENSGLISEAQDRNLRNWYVDKYGQDAFEDVLNKISDDMLAKGGAFEGLSQKQALRIAEALIVHQNEFSQSARALEAFLNPCKDAQLSLADAEQIRKDGYRITEEGLVENGVYDQGVWARYYVTGDCNEDGHVVYEKVDNNQVTQASNEFYSRLYVYNKPVKPEPIVFTFENEHEGSRIILDNTKELIVEPTVRKYKGNNLDIDTSKDLGEIDAKEVASKKVSEKKNILVEQTGENQLLNREENSSSNSGTRFTFDEEETKQGTTAETYNFSFEETNSNDVVANVEENNSKKDNQPAKASSGRKPVRLTEARAKRKAMSKKRLEQMSLEQAREEYLAMQKANEHKDDKAKSDKTMAQNTSTSSNPYLGFRAFRDDGVTK